MRKALVLSSFLGSARGSFGFHSVAPHETRIQTAKSKGLDELTVSWQYTGPAICGRRRVRLHLMTDGAADSGEKEFANGSRSPVVNESDGDDSGASLRSDIFFESDDEECGDMCLLVDSEDPSSFATAAGQNQDEKQRRFNRAVDNALYVIPLVAPLVAYFAYESVAQIFSLVVEFLSNKNWEAVDGGAYSATIIAPAINGIVVPAVAILFATLISNTVTTLRQRQLDIRTTLNMEAGEIRVLQAMVDAVPPGVAQDKCRSYLIQYTSRLIAESQPGVELNSLEFTGSIDSEMNGFLAQLNEMNVANAGSENAFNLPGSLLSETYGAVTRLNSERSTRISALESTFPVLHYGILSALAFSILSAFLMETNQELLIFLNAIQLKLLWTILIGTYSALGVICYDLSDPFRGSYQISRTVDQLYTIRSALCAAQKMAKAARENDDEY